ncbi:hypothetical protein LXL04_003506 [Taraxacum kok-saghyz]
MEERRADWGYSKPVVALDMTWNLAFVAVSVVLLICTLKEKPNVPIRVWICGYALQCAVHAVLVWLEYSRRSRRLHEEETTGGSESNYNDSEDDDGRIGAFLTSNSIRLTVVFLAFDVFFAIFCVVLARLIGIALCCCLPCIIAILYAVAGQVSNILNPNYNNMQEGASEADLNIIPKYKFQLSNNDENKPDVGAGRMIPVSVVNSVSDHIATTYLYAT